MTIEENQLISDKKPTIEDHLNSKSIMSDLVAIWEIPLSDCIHKVEFEHGTTSGKRIIRVDGKEILRKDWMFKLIGQEIFEINKTKCIINITPLSGFMYEYTMTVNGKELQKFIENQTKIMKTWILNIAGIPTRVVLEKDTLDVWVNGQKIEATGEFVEDGTETHFNLGVSDAYIKAVNSGKKKVGISYILIVGGMVIPESVD